MSLSGSKHPAYHLRPNKAVDRFLFVELLHTLELQCSLSKHKYIGFGGPFLEDFRVMSQEFPRMELLCIERDKETYNRQIFHVCTSKMQCTNRSLNEFLETDFPTDQPVIFWADYNNMVRQNIAEISDIARKAIPGSLLRVTVNAKSPILKRLELTRFPIKVPEDKKEEFAIITREYSSDMTVPGVAFNPEWFEWTEFSKKNYPRLLARMIGAVLEGSCTKPKSFLPLHTVKYSDGTIMLSITGMICLSEERASLEQHFKERCAYFSATIDEVDVIDVPNLTTKERLLLEKDLPTADTNGKICTETLGYLIEGSKKDSIKKMEQFERYYRLYPHFGKVTP